MSQEAAESRMSLKSGKEITGDKLAGLPVRFGVTKSDIEAGWPAHHGEGSGGRQGGAHTIEDQVRKTRMLRCIVAYLEKTQLLWLLDWQ